MPSSTADAVACVFTDGSDSTGAFWYSAKRLFAAIGWVADFILSTIGLFEMIILAYEPVVVFLTSLPGFKHTQLLTSFWNRKIIWLAILYKDNFKRKFQNYFIERGKIWNSYKHSRMYLNSGVSIPCLEIDAYLIWWRVDWIERSLS